MPSHRHVLVVSHFVATVFGPVLVPGLEDDSLSVALWINLVSLNLGCSAHLLLAHLPHLSALGPSYLNRIALTSPPFLILCCFLCPFVL